MTHKVIGDNPKDEELKQMLKKGYFTVTTIAKDDPLQDSFDTWLEVNGQRFGVNFDIGQLNALIQDSNKELIDKIIEALPGESTLATITSYSNEGLVIYYKGIAHNELLSEVKEILTKKK